MKKVNFYIASMIACNFFYSNISHAQTLPQIRIFLSDTCDGSRIGQSNQCNTLGTRTVGPQTITITPNYSLRDPRQSLITSIRDITYDGDLYNIDLDIVRAAGDNFNDYRASITEARVNVNSNFRATTLTEYIPGFNDFILNNVINGSSSNYRNVKFNSHIVDSIFLRATLDIGQSFIFLNTPDPTAVSASNTVNLSGTFRPDYSANPSVLQWGTVTGQATLITADGPTFQASPVFDTRFAPYMLQVTTSTPKVTTQIDETGLITPKIAVTDGINMNGSKVTNLADGTAAGDAVNKRQLDGEAAARAAADIVLQNSIAAEAATRAAADTTLQNNITAEAATRAAADVALQNSIGNEAALRAQANLQLTQRIATEEANRAALGGQLINEVNARVAADLSLQNQLGTLGSRVDRIETHIAQIDDRIASSTAVAVAMSGNSFLPDTTFNLTANVGTYDGAHAGSFQIAALISRNIAVNAGVATGFNRSGKTAGRVGMTIGW